MFLSRCCPCSRLRDGVILDSDDLNDLEQRIADFPDYPDEKAWTYKNERSNGVGAATAQRNFRRTAYIALTKFIRTNDF